MLLTRFQVDPTQDGDTVGSVDGSGELEAYFLLNEGPELCRHDGRRQLQTMYFFEGDYVGFTY